MSCKCHKPVWKDYETPPNTICIYCADKHLSLAQMLYDELAPMKNRIGVLGELECALKHLGSGYPDMADALRAMLSGYMTGIPIDQTGLVKLMDGISAIGQASSNGEDRHTGMSELPYMRQDKPGAPFICELSLAFAVRLLDEAGYEKANRHMGVGALTMAQLCAAKWNMEYMKAIRNFRHDYQVGRTFRHGDGLDEFVNKVSNDVVEHIQEYVGLYGKDFSWFLNI